MDIDTRCYLCNRLDEDGAHHLLKCKEVRKVWQELNLETVKCKLTEATSARRMMEMILELESRAKLKVITLLWLWWSERNTQREEGHRCSAIEVAYVAASLSDHFPTTEKTLSATAVVQRRRWQKPPEGILKLNSDGAFFNQEKSGGWGFVIRSDNGHVVLAGAGCEDFIQDAFHAEILGMLAGVRAAANLGTSRLQVETDTTMVRDALETEYRLSTMGGIITEVKLLLYSEFSSFSICLSSSL